tara:strand:- start:640 stop:816 length:177 start_codon:yes stop_codon:yes gene_type:complete
LWCRVKDCICTGALPVALKPEPRGLGLSDRHLDHKISNPPLTHGGHIDLHTAAADVDG